MGDYEVGYGKPPAKHRFTEGKSGNPKGRPKGSRNISTLLEKISNERVTITENGKPLRLTKAEVALRQLVNKALKGDMRALDRLMAHIIANEQRLYTAEQSRALALSPAQEKALRERLQLQAATYVPPSDDATAMESEDA